MATVTPNSGKRFRLILREGGMSREMGGDDSTVGVQIVDKIFTEALENGSSDIHIQPERNSCRIRFRIDGMMHQIGHFNNEHAANVLARLKLAASMHIDEKRRAQDGRIDMEFMGRRFSARVSMLPTLHGEKVVMRLLDPANAKIEIDTLGMPADIKKSWLRAIEAPYGMIIVTGPTGSGKTSTLYASINKLDRQRKNIVTVEDPIEYEFNDLITQVMVSERMGFAKVMRSFLRQDPDVMMVGEMRDPESLGIGIQASLTGHLVMTTLHTNNAVETLGRMIDMGGEPYLIASTVVCILGQRLVRTICPECKEKYIPTDDELFALGITPAESANMTFHHGKGCSNCRNTGLKGRVGVFELLMMTPAYKELVAKNATALEIHRYAKSQSMRSMMEDGLDKVLRGITTPAEVIRAVYSSASVESSNDEDEVVSDVTTEFLPDGAEDEDDDIDGTVVRRQLPAYE